MSQLFINLHIVYPFKSVKQALKMSLHNYSNLDLHLNLMQQVQKFLFCSNFLHHFQLFHLILIAPQIMIDCKDLPLSWLFQIDYINYLLTFNIQALYLIFTLNEPRDLSLFIMEFLFSSFIKLFIYHVMILFLTIYFYVGFALEISIIHFQLIPNYFFIKTLNFSQLKMNQIQVKLLYIQVHFLLRTI